MASFLGSRHSTVHLPTIVHADVYLDVLCCAAVGLDRWESLKVAWMARSADRGVEDMEAAAQEDHLLPRATEGPAVALLHSDAERREFISAGAAAGLAVSPYINPASQLHPPADWLRHGTRCEIHVDVMMLKFTQPLCMLTHHITRRLLSARPLGESCSAWRRHRPTGRARWRGGASFAPQQQSSRLLSCIPGPAPSL